jgi:hypothetical protein
MTSRPRRSILIRTILNMSFYPVSRRSLRPVWTAVTTNTHYHRSYFMLSNPCLRPIAPNLLPLSKRIRSYSLPAKSPSKAPSIEESNQVRQDNPSHTPKSAAEKHRQSMTELDAEHLAKLKEAMGGADLSNAEMEDGVPDRGMRRNVRENMFRIM